jgi:hypothetical protein
MQVFQPNILQKALKCCEIHSELQSYKLRDILFLQHCKYESLVFNDLSKQSKVYFRFHHAEIQSLTKPQRNSMGNVTSQ